jgi:hypothetical protein
MALLDTLPPEPLDQAEIERIRTRENVESFIVIGTASIHHRYPYQTTNATTAVALIDDSVYKFEFNGAEWDIEILQQDVDRHDYLNQALGQL